LFWTLYSELRWPLFDSFNCEKPIRLNYPQSVLNSGPVHSSFSRFIFLLFITVYSCCFPIPCQLPSLLYLCAVDYINACGLFEPFISPDSDVIVWIIYNFVTHFKRTACWTADNLVLSVKSLRSVFDGFVEELYFLFCFYELLLWPFVSCVFLGGCL